MSNDAFDADECSVFTTTNDPALVNQIRYIKAIKFLHLLFYVDEAYKGENMIREAAKTRLHNITSKKEFNSNNCYNSSKSVALIIPIKSIDEVVITIPKIIKEQSEDGNKKVIVSEMGFFSHADWDGPISYNTPIIICPLQRYIKQMDMCGWEQIKVKWADNAKCVFYGCNTANPKAKLNFAQNISNLPNFKNVEVWGQTSTSYPSFYPDYRVSSVERENDIEILWSIGDHTYLVAGNASGKEYIEKLRNLLQVSKLGIGRENLTSEQLEYEGFPRALPMNCYKNGKFITASHQGIFNDHRRTF